MPEQNLLSSPLSSPAQSLPPPANQNQSLEQQQLNGGSNKQQVSNFMSALNRVGAGSNNSFMASNPNNGANANNIINPSNINGNNGGSDPNTMVSQNLMTNGYNSSGNVQPGNVQPGNYSNNYQSTQGNYSGQVGVNPGGYSQGGSGDGTGQIPQYQPPVFTDPNSYTPNPNQSNLPPLNGYYGPTNTPPYVAPPNQSNLPPLNGNYGPTTAPPYVAPIPAATTPYNPSPNPLAVNYAPTNPLTNNYAPTTPPQVAPAPPAATTPYVNPYTNNYAPGIPNTAYTNPIPAATTPYVSPMQSVINNYAPGTGSTNTSASYTPLFNYSDENLKTNINSGDKNINDFLNTINAHNYEYKDKQDGVGQFTSPMAQELEQTELGKQAVINTPRGKMVDYGRLGGVNLAAVSVVHRENQKLQQQVDQLRKDMNKIHNGSKS